MTEKALGRLVEEAKSRWALLDVTVIHRIGRLLPGDPIVLVAVASSHRGEAFAACEFIMDYLKTRRLSGRRKKLPQASAGSRHAPATTRPPRAGIPPDLAIFPVTRQRTRRCLPAPQRAYFQKSPIAPFQAVRETRQRSHAPDQVECRQRLP